MDLADQRRLFETKLTDIGMRWTMPYLQQAHEPARPREENNLFRHGHDGEERSGIRDLRVLERRLYTRARLSPAAGVTLAAAAGAAALFALHLR